MDEMNKNKMDDMEMDKVSGGRCNPGGSKKRPRDSNANSMAANIMGATENGAMMPKPQPVVPIDPSTPKD